MTNIRSDGRDAAVVEIDRYRRREEASAIAAIEAHWSEVRGGRLLPDRADLSPAAIEPYLSRAFILERIARGQARFRIVGRRLGDMARHDLRGVPFSTLFSTDARKPLQTVISSVLEEPAHVRLTLSGDVAMTLLPLRSDQGDISRILGAVDIADGFENRPRFEILDLNHRTLIGYAAAPVPTPRRVKPAGSRSRAGHLRLVVNR